RYPQTPTPRTTMPPAPGKGVWRHWCVRWLSQRAAFVGDLGRAFRLVDACGGREGGRVRRRRGRGSRGEVDLALGGETSQRRQVDADATARRHTGRRRFRL